MSETMMPFPSDLLLTVERAAVGGWPAREAIDVDGWIYRRSGGGSVRANSVATIVWRGTDLDASITEVERLARARNGDAFFTVSDVSSPAGLDEVLAGRGYQRGVEHLTLVKAANGEQQPPAGVEIGDTASLQWLSVYLASKSPDKHDANKAIITTLERKARFLSAIEDGVVISCGLTVLDDTVASVQCMASLAEYQRRGGAERVLRAIETIASVRGARFLYLQVEADNGPALALYRKFGFSPLGSYHTRSKILI